MRSRVASLLARVALVAGILPATACAQNAHADSIQAARDCADAQRVIELGHPAKREAWAMSQIVTCGIDGAVALARGYRNARSEPDTAVLNRLTMSSYWMQDAGVTRTALEIAADRGASEPARVFSIRTLIWALEPALMVRYADLVHFTPGTNARCTSMGNQHAPTRVVQPITDDLRSRISEFAERTAEDESEDAVVQSAAECLRLYDDAD